MKIVKISLLSFLILGLVSCKKTLKEASESIFENSTEKIFKKGLKTELTEEGISAIKKMDLSDFRKFIDNENINIGKSFKSLDDDIQRLIKKSFEDDINFRRTFLKKPNIITEYQSFLKKNNLSKIEKDANFFKWYVLASKKSDNLSQPSLFKTIQIQEKNGIVYFIGENNTPIAKYKGHGIIELSNVTKSDEILNNPLLKGDFLPNSLYQIKGKMGVSTTWEIDNLGRVKSIKGNYISPEQMQNILHHNTEIKLDPSYTIEFQKLKQSSNDGFVNFDFKYTYTDESSIPTKVKIEGNTTKKNIINAPYPNRITEIVYDWKTNSALLDKFSSQFKKLTPDKKTKLLQEMDYNPELAKSIHQNPQRNIERYLNAHNPVNSNLIDKIDGKMPINAKVYAGNTFYFDPLYNPALSAKLKESGTLGLKGHGGRKMDIKMLKDLDEIYPNGVKWSKKGYPDFASLKDKNGNSLITIDIGKLSGDSKADIHLADQIFVKNGGVIETGYTWHHIEHSTKLVRVPSHLHDAVPHSGGMATHRAITK